MPSNLVAVRTGLVGVEMPAPTFPSLTRYLQPSVLNAFAASFRRVWTTGTAYALESVPIGSHIAGVPAILDEVSNIDRPESQELASLKRREVEVTSGSHGHEPTPRRRRASSRLRRVPTMA
jgi:hypothetical protein